MAPHLTDSKDDAAPSADEAEGVAPFVAAEETEEGEKEEEAEEEEEGEKLEATGKEAEFNASEAGLNAPEAGLKVFGRPNAGSETASIIF